MNWYTALGSPHIHSVVSNKATKIQLNMLRSMISIAGLLPLLAVVCEYGISEMIVRYFKYLDFYYVLISHWQGP